MHLCMPEFTDFVNCSELNVECAKLLWLDFCEIRASLSGSGAKV
jgi:hypothetical protein